MSQSINTIIAQLRKEKGITQEELAAGIGVSGQAVSKWETSASSPDISLLPSIARYFNVSIDRLMDYRIWEMDNKFENTLKHLREGMRNPKEAIEISRRAVVDYPNNYEVLYLAGLILVDYGMSNPKKEDMKACINEGIPYLKTVINQSDNKWLIISASNSLAWAYFYTDKFEDGIKVYEHIAKISENHCYDIEIGNFKREAGDIKGARKILQNKLYMDLSKMNELLRYLAYCALDENNTEMAIDYYWLSIGIDSLMTGESGNYFDSHLAETYEHLAGIYHKRANNLEASLECLEKAAYHAQRFDEANLIAWSENNKYIDTVEVRNIDATGPRSALLLDLMEKYYPKLQDKPEYKLLLDKVREVSLRASSKLPVKFDIVFDWYNEKK